MNKKLEKKERKFLSMFIVASMLLANMAVVPTSKAAAESVIYFSEVGTLGVQVTDKTVNAGDDFTLVATINPNANEITAAELHVSFDHSKFSLSSITAPDAPADCSATPTFSVPLQSATINNTNGTGSITLGVCMPGDGFPATPVVTVTPVATFVFHAISGTSGPLPISFTGSIASAAGETENVVASTVPVDVKVDSPDVTAPVLSGGTPTGTLAAGTTQATVAVTTNENATCKYSTSSGVAFGSMTGVFTTTGAKMHSFVASGLSSGGSYGYFVKCKDLNDNSNQSDYLISFAVASPAVVVPVSQPATTSSTSSSHHKSDKKKKTPKRYVSNSKKKIARGKVLIQRGKKFSKNNYVLLYFSKFGGGYYAPQKIRTSSSGAFMISYLVNKPIGTYNWYAVDLATGQRSKTVSYKVK